MVHHFWPVGQAAKTAASHAANVGSIPARVTIFLKQVNIEDLLLKKAVRREEFSREVFFAYFLFQKKVNSWC